MKGRLLRAARIATACTTAFVLLAPAGARALIPHASTNVTRLAYAEWTERTDRFIIRWRVDARQMVAATSWLSPASSATQIMIVWNRCWRDPERAFVVKGRRYDCHGASRSWKVQPQNFAFDPLMEQVTVAFGSGRTVTWTATGEPALHHHEGRSHWVRANQSTLIAGAQVSPIVYAERPAEVEGRLAGRDLSRVARRTGIVTWYGAYAHWGLCLVDGGTVCT